MAILKAVEDVFPTVLSWVGLVAICVLAPTVGVKAIFYLTKWLNKKNRD